MSDADNQPTTQSTDEQPSANMQPTEPEQKPATEPEAKPAADPTPAQEETPKPKEETKPKEEEAKPKKEDPKPQAEKTKEPEAPAAKREEQPPKKAEPKRVPAKKKEESPEPENNATLNNSPSVCRPTAASRAPSPNPSKVETPELVKRIQSMTAMERVKEEWKMHREVAHQRARSPAFGGMTPRDGRPKSKPPMIEKRDQIQKEHLEEKFRRLGGIPDTNPPAYKLMKKERGSMPWAKADGDRHKWQHNWKNLPATVRQRSCDPAPGPGAYGKSTSFMTPRWN